MIKKYLFKKIITESEESEMSLERCLYRGGTSIDKVAFKVNRDLVKINSHGFSKSGKVGENSNLFILKSMRGMSL